MSKLYKLTLGSVSVIRTDKAGVEEALAAGYIMQGEVNEKYEVISTAISFEDKAKAEKAARDALEAEAKELKIGTAKAISAMSDIDLAAAVEKAKAEKA